MLPDSRRSLSCGTLFDAGLGGTGELRAGDDGHVEVARELLEGARDVADLLDAVLVAHAGLHELEVVDDDEVEAAAFALELAAPSTRISAIAEHGGVVEVDGEVGEKAERLRDLALVAVGVLAEGEARGIDAGFHGEHALHELLGGHLDREEGDGRRLALGGDFAKLRTSEVLPRLGRAATMTRSPRLRPGEDGVEVHEAGGDGPDVAGDGADAALPPIPGSR